MSGLSIGKNRASRFCQAAPAFAIPAKTRSWEKVPLRCFVDRLLEPLPGGECGQRLGADLDFLAVHRASAGARFALARQKCAEADHGDALALRDVLDDGVEHGVHRLACCRPAEISRLCRDLHEIRLRYYMSHLYSPAFLRSIVAKPKRKHNEVAHALAQAFMITREEAFIQCMHRASWRR